MFKTFKNLKEYSESKWIGYCHFITQKNKWEAWDDLLEIQKDWNYIDKNSLLIHLLNENQKKMQ
mgnify:CR=1 FL=1